MKGTVDLKFDHGNLKVSATITIKKCRGGASAPPTSFSRDRREQVIDSMDRFLLLFLAVRNAFPREFFKMDFAVLHFWIMSYHHFKGRSLARK